MQGAELVKRSTSIQLWLIVCLLAGVVALLGYQLVDGLNRGVVVSSSRVGKAAVYSLENEPKLYWFTIAWLCVIETVLLILTLGTSWLAVKVSGR